MMLGLNQGFINMKAVLDPIGQPSTLSLSDGGRYQWGLEEDISLTIIRDFPTGGRIMAATSKSRREEKVPTATALIKLCCQLKALLLFFPGRFEIQNSPLLSQDHGASLRPTLSLFDQAIFNLSLKSLPLSPPSRSAADIG